MKTRKEVLAFVRKGGKFLTEIIPQHEQILQNAYQVPTGTFIIFLGGLKGSAILKGNCYKDSFWIGYVPFNSSIPNITENIIYSEEEIKEIFEKYYYNYLLNKLNE